MVLKTIKLGDEVIWAVTKEYSDEFKVLDIYPHQTLTDESSQPLFMALLEPVNEARFMTVMSDVIPSGSQVQVEAPVASLSPIVIHREH